MLKSIISKVRQNLPNNVFQKSIIARNYRTFQPGDIVISRHVLNPGRPYMSDPLTEGKVLKLGRDSIPHADILNLPPRSTVVTPKGQRYIFSYPTMEEYIIHRKRMAQPIYSLDAAAIVSLADIHEDGNAAMGYSTGFGRITGTITDRYVTRESEEAAALARKTEQEQQTSSSNNNTEEENGSEKKEAPENVQAENAPVYEFKKPETYIKTRQYLEAGTGHGSLTLQIARAIHAANEKSRETGDLSLRGAILHSVDRNAVHSKTGRVNVRDFRRGLYYGDVEFHVAESVEAWLKKYGTYWARQGVVGPGFRPLFPEYNPPTPEELAANAAAAAKEGEEINIEQEEKKEATEEEKEKETAVEELIKDDEEDSFESPGAFLSGAFLDLPSPEASIKTVAQCLIVDAPLIVFTPSISQILNVVKMISQDENVDLTLVNAIELMPGIAGGSMRAWDIRHSVIRATGEEAVVCRPRVGDSVAGGGFVAKFHKLPYRSRKRLAEKQRQQALEKEAQAANTQEASS